MRFAVKNVVNVPFTTFSHFMLKITHFLLDKILEVRYNVVKCNYFQLIQHYNRRNKMGKSPLNVNAVKTIRRLVQHKPLHSLLLNLGCDLMLRASDLLKLKVRDVITEDGTVKDVVKVKQKKTGKVTIDIPLSDNSKRTIQENLLGKELDDFIFVGQKSHYTRKPISTNQYQRIIKSWMKMIGTEDVSAFSSHSMRKTKASVLYKRTNNVEAVRRLLGHQSVTATSSYLGVEDSDATALAKSINI